MSINHKLRGHKYSHRFKTKPDAHINLWYARTYIHARKSKVKQILRDKQSRTRLAATIVMVGARDPRKENGIVGVSEANTLNIGLSTTTPDLSLVLHVERKTNDKKRREREKLEDSTLMLDNNNYDYISRVYTRSCGI